MPEGDDTYAIATNSTHADSLSSTFVEEGTTESRVAPVVIGPEEGWVRGMQRPGAAMPIGEKQADGKRGDYQRYSARN